MGGCLSCLTRHPKILNPSNEVQESISEAEVHFESPAKEQPSFDSVTTEGAFVRSGLSGKDVTFRWEIENFDVLLTATSDSKLIETQKVELSAKLLKKDLIDEDDQDDDDSVLTKWIVCLSDSDKDWVGILLKLDSCAEKSHVFASLQIRIPNVDGSGYFLNKSSSTVLLSDTPPEFCGWSKIFNRKEVKMLPLRESGTLVIEGKIRAVTMIESVQRKKFETNFYRVQAAATKKLGEDLEAFCGHHGDDLPIGGVKIISSEGTEHYSNKVILSARSPVFAAMFKSGMREETENVLILEDCCATSVSSMLRYVHTGQLLELVSDSDPCDIDDFGKVAHIADKYDLGELHEFCDKFIALLVTGIKMEKVLEVLEIANKFRLKRTATEISTRLSGNNYVKWSVGNGEKIQCEIP